MRHERFSHGDLAGPGWPGVSIILPILNEENYLQDSVSSILSQEYSGQFEVILALGPSRDKTNEVAQTLANADSRVKLVESPTGRTAAGLNLAIAASQFPVIVRIDGHAQIERDYVYNAVATLLRTGAVNVGGVMAAQGVTFFEKVVALAMRSPLGVGSSRFHIGGVEGSVDTVYLGCFDKAALLAAGGYDERFTRAQDWELNFRLRSNGGVIWFNPDLIVLYRPRPTLKKLSSQYFQYGRWRHAVVRNHKGSVNFRYLAPPALVTLLTLSIIAAFFIPITIVVPLGYFAALYAGSVVIGKASSPRLRTVLLLPLVIATMHISWGLGYLTSPAGLIVDEGADL
jgi:glycosyltransferase involved in cell wall biosynthesis